MPIETPLPKDTRSQLADWLEVESLVRSRGVATRGDVLRLYDFLEDDGHDVELDEATGEELETEILEGDRAECAEDVLSEIEHRALVLGEHYPFELDVPGPQWRIIKAPVSEDTTTVAARACYIFCLLTSAIRDKRIHGPAVAMLQQTMANHFQAVSTDAAAGVLNGEAISFGWPRKSGQAFQPALEDASRRLRLGKPLHDVPLWSSGKEKDAGIDVIAWRDFPDGRPGKLIMLGQVASGRNWTEKSVNNDTSRFFAWFSERPAQHFIPSIFIPFPQHHDCSGRSDAAFEAVADAEAWYREQEFGLVIDRLRIVEAAAVRLAADDEGTAASTLTVLNRWVKAALDLARATS